LEADSAAAIKALTGILNHDAGAALAADNATLVASGMGFAADAMDVSGNNIAIGGATYVGSATTVATATSVNGLAMGSIPVTATPNLANGTGGTAAAPPTSTGGTPPATGGTPPTTGGTPPTTTTGHHHHHHGNGTAAAHATAATHTAAAAVAAPVIDHHAMHHMWA